MSYYKNFKIVIGTPLWRIYLRWVYSQSIEDFKKLEFSPNFEKKDFSCLLCGVGNEVTADEFISFVLAKNDQAKIWIIDLGSEQIDAVSKLVSKKYPKKDINIKQINALSLDSLIKQGSLDWIETDGVFEYFDNNSLEKLLEVWKKLLSESGFITTRACSVKGPIDYLLDQIKIWGGKAWLNVVSFSHKREYLHRLFKNVGFKFVEGSTPLYHFKRYSLIND